MLTVKFHLMPLTKILKVNVREKEKYEMLIKLAKTLMEENHMHINQTTAEDTVNYISLKRDMLTCKTNVELAIELHLLQQKFVTSIFSE